MLLLRAGQVVPADRLMEDLWGGRPPESAPTALQQHVSRLRKVLGAPGVLVTRAPGYVLELAGHDLDLRRFTRLRDEAAQELAAGRPAAAARLLREALALWRGPPLADLQDEDFARGAVAGLEDLRLGAQEARIEADLADGRHREVVGELRALAREHPLRERLHADLMLALYRSGRQAQALEAYAAARRVLVEELGLEPGHDLRRLQHEILTHDPALRLPSPPRTVHRRRRRGAAAGIALLAAALAVATASVLGGSGPDVAPPARPATLGGQLVEVDEAGGRVTRRIAAGRTPTAVAIGDDRVWLVDGDARTVLAVTPASGAVETLATGATPTDLAAGVGAVWVAQGRASGARQFVGAVARTVVRLDPATGTPRGEARLPARAAGTVSNLADNRVAATPGAIWAVTPDAAVVRIDDRTAAVTATSRAVRAVAVAAGGAGVWVLGADGTVVRLDPRTARPRFRARMRAQGATALAVGEDAAWVGSSTAGRLWRIDARPRRPVRSVAVGTGISDVAAGRAGAWVVNPPAGTLVHVDAAGRRISRTVRLGGIPRSVAVGGGSVWVAVTGGAAAAARSAPSIAGVTPVRARECAAPVGGGGRVDALIVSDLPLQGGTQILATQMVQAITFALRERGFRAGRLRVAYQSCDDSVARTGLFDEGLCAANARAYGRARDVLGVIGPMNSPCAVRAIPELNRAPGGGLATVSPLNSFVGLTRTGVGVDPRLPGALYPTGRRTYARVHPTDDLQGAALALLARDRGRRRAFVLSDGEPGYGALMAEGFAAAARRLGLEVVGRGTWDPRRRGFRPLARRVARSGADAVFLGGLLDTGGARVLRDVRRELPAGAGDILAPDGFTPVPLLVETAGAAARDVFVSLGGVVTEGLPATGRRWVERFARTQPGVEVQPAAVYAAQATHVLLDAIAASDGTRRSVVAELLRTRVEDGLIGSFSFDPNGDVSESPVTVLRPRRQGAPGPVLSTEGATVERVVRPRSRLVG